MNTLIKVGDNAVAKQTDDAFTSMVENTGFLSRVQLMTANSGVCKSGAFPINSYALIDGQSNTDLGKTVDVLVVAVRAKAIDMSGEDVLTSYDHTADLFNQIKDKSAEQNSGCMFGPEFLIYLPDQKKFASLFLGSKSSRTESPKLKAMLYSAATLGSQHIETKKFDWYTNKFSKCSASFELPSQEDIDKEVLAFRNPKTAEVVEETNDTDSSDRVM